MGGHGDTEPQDSDATPLCPVDLEEVYCPSSGVKRCPLFGGSVYISLIYRRIGRCKGQMSVGWRCPLFGV